MISELNRWTSRAGALLLMAASYIMFYSPNFENIKIIIPLLGAVCGWVLRESLD